MGASGLGCWRWGRASQAPANAEAPGVRPSREGAGRGWKGAGCTSKGSCLEESGGHATGHRRLGWGGEWCQQKRHCRAGKAEEPKHTWLFSEIGNVGVLTGGWGPPGRQAA